MFFTSRRICRTRTNTGTKPVSCAANVAFRWWTNSSGRRWRKSIAETATTHSSRPGVTDAETSFALVICLYDFIITTPGPRFDERTFGTLFKYIEQYIYIYENTERDLMNINGIVGLPCCTRKMIVKPNEKPPRAVGDARENGGRAHRLKRHCNDASIWVTVNVQVTSPSKTAVCRYGARVCVCSLDKSRASKAAGR